MSLADLMRKGSLRALATTACATATPATVATHETGYAATVAEVATVAVAKSPDSKAANDPALDPDRDPDRWCWPHSDAMTGAEIDRMVSRVERFVARGVDLIDATVLADRLVIRDRDGDDRRLCLECDHLRRAGRCGVRTVADVPGGRLIDALPILQRCNQFKKTTP
ncbi:MAG: hypothetical protein H7306_05930 [Bacteriovorax sp.]|nr:hypothetical protein [Rhizobacter sp.]